MPGIGISWSYARCVWPEMIIRMLASAPLTICPKRESSVALAMSGVSAPSWTRRISTSASPFASSPSVSVAGDPVDLGHDRLHLDRRDALRADQRRQLLGHGADEADGHAVVLHQLVLLERRLIGRPVVEVRRQVRPVGLGQDAVVDIRATLVELVVAERAHVEPGRVERVDRRLVVLDERRERRRADQVARRDERRVGVRRLVLLHDSGEHRSAARGRDRLDAPVEVVDADQVDRDRHGRGVRRRARPGRGRSSGTASPRRSPPNGYPRSPHSAELISHTPTPVTAPARDGVTKAWSSEPSMPLNE